MFEFFKEARAQIKKQKEQAKEIMAAVGCKQKGYMGLFMIVAEELFNNEVPENHVVGWTEDGAACIAVLTDKRLISVHQHKLVVKHSKAIQYDKIDSVDVSYNRLEVHFGSEKFKMKRVIECRKFAKKLQEKLN